MDRGARWATVHGVANVVFFNLIDFFKLEVNYLVVSDTLLPHGL